MMLAQHPLLRCLRAESLKLKRAPLLWMSLLGGWAIACGIMLLFYFNAGELLDVGSNPWDAYAGFSFAVVSLLFLTPYITLAGSIAVYPEHRAHGWKWLYSLPPARHHHYLSKLLLLSALLAVTYLLFFGGIFGTGYLLGYLLPAYGFHDYPAGAGEMAIIFLRSFRAGLGVVGLQYFLSIRWRHYLGPIGIGLAGYIITPILMGKTVLAYFLPYAYPLMIVQGLDVNPGYVVDDMLVWGLSTVEWYSLGYFALFTLLGILLERRRNIT